MAAQKADLSNWRTPPHNIWAFANVDKILPTHKVSKGDRTAAVLETSKSQATFEGFSVQTAGSSPQTIDFKAWLDHTNTDSLIVLHEGHIVHEYYANDNTAESRHIIFSISKSITGLITGILANQGRLDVSAPIKQYVPSASSIWDGATVQQCLDMQTGVKFDDGLYRREAGWAPLDGGEKAKTLHSFLEVIEAERDEGKGFNYSSVNTDLLGWALENATGKKLAQLISELLWQPLGAQSDAYLTVDSEGSARAAGGLCVTVRDLARVGVLLSQKDASPVPEAWLQDMLTGGDTEKFANGAFAPAFKGLMAKPAYRDCWITDAETETLCAMGVFGQNLWVDRKNQVVVAKMSSQEAGQDFLKAITSLRGYRELTRVLVG